MVHRAPMAGPEMLNVSALANVWLDNCRTYHKHCKMTDTPLLPTRILHLSVIEGSLSVRLKESKGMRARYCALSHCWGPVEKRPLRTTTENVAEHLQGIAIFQLPKTFREAVEFTRGVGIEYLWIDSLCIVQDDHNDWHSESATMCSIYEHAELVIAAAGAEDSTQGLLSHGILRNEPRKLPYVVKGVTKGSFNIVFSDDARHGPTHGSLYNRAWVSQL